MKREGEGYNVDSGGELEGTFVLYAHRDHVFHFLGNTTNPLNRKFFSSKSLKIQLILIYTFHCKKVAAPNMDSTIV